MKKTLFAIVLISMAITQFNAFGDDQELQQRTQDQDARVQQGVKNGTMTQGQATAVENKDQRIDNRVNNGTESQKAANRQMNRTSRRIRRAKKSQ